ncbi:trigger factor [Planctomycetota bacterium]|nr:trigger factor [Planctomycetota bacterium]
MQVQIDDAGTLRKRITITYSVDEVAAKRDLLMGKLADQVRLPGFRPGKIPRAVIEKRVGADAQRQADEELANEGLDQATRIHGIRPLGAIAADEIARDNGLRLVFSCEVKPTITLPEPSAFTIDDAAVAVDDAEVDGQIVTMCRRLGTESALNADETVQAGDQITLSGSVLRDGAEVRKLHDFKHLVGEYPLLGKPAEDVVAALKDKKVGDVVSGLATTLPGTFAPTEHANQPAELTFTIQSGVRLRPAAVEVLLGQFNQPDLAALQGVIRTSLTNVAEDRKRRAQVESLTAQLLEKVTVEVPPLTLAKAVADTKAVAAKDGSAIPDDVDAKVAKDLRRYLILDALADQLDVRVTQDDLTQQILMAAQQTRRRPEDIAKNLKESGKLNQVGMEIREAKALELFLDRALGRPAPEAAAVAAAHGGNPAHGHAGHVHGPDCNH